MTDWLATDAGSHHIVSVRLAGDLGPSLATAPLAFRLSPAGAPRAGRAPALPGRRCSPPRDRWEKINEGI